MKNKSQIKTAPLNRAADLIKEFSGKTWRPAKAAIKTAREINAPFVPEIHMVGGGNGADAIGELFKACGWVVIYEKETNEHHKKMGARSSRRLQPRKSNRQTSRRSSS